MTLDVAAPDPLNGGRLRDELAAAGVALTAAPMLRAGRLLLDIDPADEATAAGVVAAHTGELPTDAIAAQAREADTADALDQLAALPNVRAKLRAVAHGNDTLTAAQLQRVAAAVALAAIEHREDT